MRNKLDELHKETIRTIKLLRSLPHREQLAIMLGWMGLDAQKEMNNFLEKHSENVDGRS